MKDFLEIYTDGSSLGNPGPGGWGVLIIKNKELGILNDIEIGGGEKNTTNNRMELQAVIEVFKYFQKSELQKYEGIKIYADSNYVLGGVLGWIKNWEKNGWKTANKKQVLNQDLWKELDNLIKSYTGEIVWEKVKGHSGHEYNDRVDKIATTNATKFKGR